MEQLNVIVNDHRVFTPDAQLKELGVTPIPYFRITAFTPIGDINATVMVTEANHPIWYQAMKEIVLKMNNNSLVISRPLVLKETIPGIIRSISYVTPEDTERAFPHQDDEINTKLTSTGNLTNDITHFT